LRERNSYYKEYGLLLTEITKRLNGDNEVKKQLHIAFKKCWGISSLTKLKNDELWRYMKEIRVYFASNYGWVLKEYGEKDIEPEEMEMGEFLKYKIKEMEKLKIEYLAPYLPFKLMFQLFKHQLTYGKTDILPMNGLSLDCKGEVNIELLLPNDDIIFSNQIRPVKPLLRPLSDLTKEIEINGEKFVPLIKMVAKCHCWMDYYEQGLGKCGEDITSTSSKKIYNVGYGTMKIHWKVDLSYLPSLRFDYMQELFKWHFDLFGLIEKGLAIDYNDIRLINN
jgi:hypothetical protein